MTTDYVARWQIHDIGTLDQVGFVTSVPVTNPREYTFTLWIYATQNQHTQVIASIEHLFEIRIENNRIRLDIFNSEKKPTQLAAPLPSLNHWQHLAFTVNDTARLYLNGMLIIKEDVKSRVIALSQLKLTIGGYTDPAGGHFDYTFGRNQTGWVDDIRWYNRPLHSDEINLLIPDAEPPPAIRFDVVSKNDTVGFRAVTNDEQAFRAYLWDFGDGSSGIGQEVTHRYAYSGDYLVRLMGITEAFQLVMRANSVTVKSESAPLRITPVFVNGTEGYACYRIPSIVRAANGDLVAFAEARLQSCSDSTDTIRLVSKRSTNNGKTWSPVQIVAQNIMDEREYVVQNGSPVVDMVHGTGRIVLLYNKMEHSEWALAQGEGVSRIYRIISDDHGITWHSEKDITLQVHHPFNPAYTDIYPDAANSRNKTLDWRIQRPTVGHALQLRSGRLLFAGTFTAGDHSVFQSKNYAFWSDDLGETWHGGAAADHVGLNEAIAVELENGDVMINSRAYIDEKPAGRRAVTIGRFQEPDKIQFAPTRFDDTLIDPAVQASIIRYTTRDQQTYGGKSRLLFANPNHSGARYNLTVRLSYDEGETWPVQKTIDPGPSAYCDLVIQDDMRIGLLYERGNQGGIAYVNFTLNWLTEGQDNIED